jgi:hypothetical protein
MLNEHLSHRLGNAISRTLYLFVVVVAYAPVLEHCYDRQDEAQAKHLEHEPFCIQGYAPFLHGYFYAKTIARGFGSVRLRQLS